VFGGERCEAMHVDVGRDHGCTFARKCECARATNTRSGSRDECTLSCEAPSM
jgi:hypothetical protein